MEKSNLSRLDVPTTTSVPTTGVPVPTGETQTNPATQTPRQPQTHVQESAPLLPARKVEVVEIIPLPKYLEPKSILESAKALFGPSDEEKDAVKQTALRILDQMGLSKALVGQLVGAWDFDKRARLCQLFCGSHPQASRLGDKFVVSARCSDFPLLQDLAMLIHEKAPKSQIPVKLACASALALFDQPHLAARALKFFCRIAGSSPMGREILPHSMMSLVERVLAQAPGELTVGEIDILTRLMAEHSKATQDPVMQNAFEMGTIAVLSTARSSGLEVSSNIVLSETRASDDPTTSTQGQDASDAYQAASDAYEQVKHSLPIVAFDTSGRLTHKGGTITAQALMNYLEVAVEAGGFIPTSVLEAHINYGKAQPDSPFTPALVRSLWATFGAANPMDVEAAAKNWLETIGVEFAEALTIDQRAQKGPVDPALVHLPSREELQDFVKLLVPRAPGAPFDRVDWLQGCLKNICANLKGSSQITTDESREKLKPMIDEFEKLIDSLDLRELAFREHSRILADPRLSLTYEEVSTILSAEQQSTFSDQAQLTLLRSMLQMQPKEFVELALRFKVLFLSAEGANPVLRAALDALVLEASGASCAAVLALFEEAPGAPPPDLALRWRALGLKPPLSSSIVSLLGAALMSRLLQNDLTDAQCGTLAAMLMQLAAPMPGEGLSACVMRFFQLVTKDWPRDVESRRKLVASLERLQRALAVLAMPETDSGTLCPHEGYAALVATAACAAQRCIHSMGAKESKPGIWQRLLLGIAAPLGTRAKALFFICVEQQFHGKAKQMGDASAAYEEFCNLCSDHLHLHIYQSGMLRRDRHFTILDVTDVATGLILLRAGKIEIFESLAHRTLDGRSGGELLHGWVFAERMNHEWSKEFKAHFPPEDT